VEVVSPLRGGREVRVSYDVNGVSRTTTTVVYDVPALGDVVHLRYDPEDPDVVSDPANDEPVEWPAWTMLAWMGTLFSSLRLFSLWWRSRRARRSR
jgi:hypothetical protein